LGEIAIGPWSNLSSREKKYFKQQSATFEGGDGIARPIRFEIRPEAFRCRASSPGAESAEVQLNLAGNREGKSAGTSPFISGALFFGVNAGNCVPSKRLEGKTASISSLLPTSRSSGTHIRLP
jgi:hypothetical protein